MQALLGAVADLKDVVGLPVLAVFERDADAGFAGVLPGGLDQHAASEHRPGLRDLTVPVALAGLLAGLAGILMTGRLDSAVTTQGQGIIFSAFAAAVIGGVSLGGGRGTIIGVVSGVLLIGVINNLLTLAQVPSFYVQASTGAVIIIAAVLTTVASRRSSGVKTRT